MNKELENMLTEKTLAGVELLIKQFPVVVEAFLSYRLYYLISTSIIGLLLIALVLKLFSKGMDYFEKVDSEDGVAFFSFCWWITIPLSFIVLNQKLDSILHICISPATYLFEYLVK